MTAKTEDELRQIVTRIIEDSLRSKGEFIRHGNNIKQLEPVVIRDRAVESVTSYTKQRELALLDRLESKAINTMRRGYLDNGNEYSEHFSAVPLLAIQKEKERINE